ncbi:MAG: S49 family peptidase [Deltaproteobacteria bacterium]|nr:S49 family peptidase [Deltaproteobacteria bacterium]
MAAIHKMDKNKGLDLILHTPGGNVAATESLVDYLRSWFGTNVRAIVPQIALSAGTMISLSCEKIIMGKHSSLGPIDPQLRGVPAHGVIEEFEQAKKEVSQNQNSMFIWQPIIAKYTPTLIGECQKAIQWSKEMTEQWLETGMFRNDPNKKLKIDKIVAEMADHAVTKAHARHISIEKAKQLGLDIIALEDDDKLQDAVLSVHHTCIHTLSATPAIKIIENHSGVAFVSAIERK